MRSVVLSFTNIFNSGKGTGLKLSLTYDTIKAHGGELKVETIEGEFAEFVVVLPVKDNL